MSMILWILLILVALIGVGYVVLRILMMGSGDILAVTWAAGEPEDPRHIKWVKAKLPELLGKTSATVKRRVCSQKRFDDCSPGHQRHEGTHVEQQDGTLFVWWFAQYTLLPSFRKHTEAAAQAAETAEYPKYRKVAPFASNWWLF